MLEYIPEQLLNETTIGIDGGELVAEGVSIVIPAGAFQQDYKIAIYKANGKGPYRGDAATGRFSISGLPRNTNEPVSLKLEHNGIADSEVFMSIGEEVLVPSLSE
ncbi:MAG: hypothetical protein HN936_19690 [Bacteroidetes bacterium]|jgi:hypothetical protein|nr:hypothetical protein [Bacteroidota bacterium]MBT4409577.1 hypothetical protein [Bacteroidota bacterium]MBT7095477.1 hypothetical protein [Bacteroidota bacterium]MBT7462685.1 hypothetical protein [Bacteroidota bacterium]